ncbi:complement factor H [Haplochromis burtoni]|uniref:complement factor H n=1 Tax=Haplochromis burtoni TaxID=8153 RepID=UPI0003BD1BFE|nr:complement factor H [Haplochromis burtoni]
MCARYLGFVLLIWFAGVTHAQNENVCRAPVLDGGYYVPEKETYFLKEELTYACDSGRKPVVEGWWATSRCEDGNWVHKPQCIAQNACLPPTIPHGKYDKAKDGWYKERDSIFVQCDDGYERKDNRSPRCRSGTWSPLPVCERRRDSCSEPPKISHAVIIHQYKEVFSEGSEVQYECEEGYTREGNNIFCERGQWTAGPTCNESSADQGPPASDTDVQPEGGDRRESGAGSGKQPEGAFCVMNATRYAHYGVAAAEPENMWEGQRKYFPCTARDKYIHVRCTNRRLDFTRCLSLNAVNQSSLIKFMDLSF